MNINELFILAETAFLLCLLKDDRSDMDVEMDERFFENN